MVQAARNRFGQQRIALHLRLGCRTATPYVVDKDTTLKRHTERTGGIVTVDNHGVNAVLLPLGRFSAQIGTGVCGAQRHFGIACDIDARAVFIFDAVDARSQKFLARHIDRLPECPRSCIIKDLRSEDDAAVSVFRHTQRGVLRLLQGLPGFLNERVDFPFVQSEEFPVEGVNRVKSLIPAPDRRQNLRFLFGFAGVVCLPDGGLYFFADNRVDTVKHSCIDTLEFVQTVEHLRLPLAPVDALPSFFTDMPQHIAPQGVNEVILDSGERLRNVICRQSDHPIPVPATARPPSRRSPAPP